MVCEFTSKLPIKKASIHQTFIMKGVVLMGEHRDIAN